MDTELEKLKDDFTKIKTMRHDIASIFDILEQRIIRLNNAHSEYIKNNTGTMFVFGLDSFKFQSKFIDIEYDDMKRLYWAIGNRMYCEYYKLFKIIRDYIQTNINDKKIFEILKIGDNFPTYKDLEPYKQYNFDLIQDLHESVIMLISGINDYITNKTTELNLHQQQQSTGYNINNFVSTCSYTIALMKENGILFSSYLIFFHILHTKYLQRFSTKLKLMSSQINHDIQFEDNYEIINQNIINNLEEDSVDSEIVNELRTSFDSDEAPNNIIHFDNKDELTNHINILTDETTDENNILIEEEKEEKEEEEEEEEEEETDNNANEQLDSNPTKKRPNRKKKKKKK